METLYPHNLDEAVAALGEAVTPLAGGTDLMVEVNFGHMRPERVLALRRVEELSEWHATRIGAGVTWRRIERDGPTALAQAARTVGSPQIQNRGTVGGNLGTASPAGDALPPLLVEEAKVELASAAGRRTLALEDFLVGPKANALAPDELIVSVRVRPSGARQTFMKVGPRNAKVIAVVSLALAVDRERGEIRAAYGSAGPVPRLVRAPLDEADGFPDRVAEAASPIDDVRGSAAYRRHALRVLTARALERCAA
jgi:CO/xanthine dehydrogenase FAD-binding subunit